MSLRRPTGQAAFAGDVVIPGTLHLALRHSPVAHGRVRRADAATARLLPGVAAVLSAEDVPRLLSAELSFVGDRLAVAAAEEPELARRAVELVTIEIERLPAVLDPELAARDEASVAGRIALAEGDVERELAGAEHVVAGEWQLPFTPALSLEPPQAITWLDEDRRLVVRTAAESPFRVRRALAERLSLPAAGIRVVRPLAAGGAGAGSLLVEDLCAAVTLRTGRPARLALSGNDQLTVCGGRPAQRVRVRLGLRAGRIVALDLRFLLDLGATGEHAAELLRSAARHALAPYAADSLRVEAIAVRTHRPPSGSSRGADAGAAFAVECAVDEAARLVGEDPGVFRRRQLRRAGAQAPELLADLGEPQGDDDERTVAALFAALPRAPRLRHAGPELALRSASGLGFARRSATTAPGAGPAASLRLLEDGSFTLSAGGATIGGADGAAETEAAAAILTVPARRVVAAAADSDSTAFEAGELSAAYATPAFAVEEAARLAREGIRERGARLLGVPIAEASVEAGHVRDTRGGSVGFAEIGTAALSAGMPLVATAAPSAASTPMALAAVTAEVEVDIEIGVVRVTRIAAAVAGGPFPDARPHQAVVEGALAAAVEQALAAGLEFDAQGRSVVCSLRDYPLLAPIDVPPLTVAFFPSGAAPTRLGDAALADVATRAALAALANAVAHATGTLVRRLPLSPPVLLGALAEHPQD